MPTSGISRVVDLEKFVGDKLPYFLIDYFATGGGDEQTLVDSVNAFKRFRLKPRVLQSKSETNIETKTQGQSICSPFGIAPTGFQSLAHPQGDVATAKAAEKAGVIMIVSSWTCLRFETIASSAPSAVLWMQLYPYADRRHTLNFIRRAERSGFQALVVTVDSPQIGIFARSIRSGYEAQDQFDSVLPNGLLNLEAAPEETEKAKASGDKYLFQYLKQQISSAAADWNYIAWMKSQTKLPIILKGILTAESAREAVAVGVHGIIVSAHGGRQLDGVQAPIEALPEIVDAVRGSKVEVYMDGGVRSGRDVFKALAIGAKAVFIGRPIIWGLAHDIG
ncbi:2-Hydroxyacid oxidase 1-like isoform X2 [Apostichopus japonicus]|uniref:2-Hydroxyacid oxidase 1-like isoform X2 n=1 Tax=Stichopus japonicus TaxID=307972 RepID=UPI003AB328A4